MKKLLLALLVVSPALIFAQFYNVPSNGSDTSNACVGILRDPGGTGNYPSYSSGYFVIDPPGSQPVNLQFTQFLTQSSYDYVRLYDGVGTSGTIIGTYSGSALPGGATGVSSTSGAITVYFYSNCCTQYSGFQATWTASGGNAPIANYIAVPTTVAFNTPVQFFNTSLFGGSYTWNFGDGNTSTDENPSHSYTSSGSYTVSLIASNCSSTDTATSTITVQAAPNATFAPDTLNLNVNCGATATGSFSITNASGAGPLNFGLDLQQQNVTYALKEDFENGLGDFTNQSPTNYTVTTTTSSSAPSGNKYINFVGDGYYADGLEATFTPVQAERFSYHVRQNSFYSSQAGLVMIGGPNLYYYYNGIFASFFSGSYLRLYYNNGSYNTYYNYAATLGQWYNIEIKNIDYSSQTYDIYVDGTLILAGAGFMNSTTTQLSEIQVYNYYNGNISLDDFEVGAETVANAITFLPNSGTVSAGSTVNVNVSVDASELLGGVYNLYFDVTSNSLTLDGTQYPILLTVDGGAELTHPTGCVNYGSHVVGSTVVDSVLLINTGCDTLISSSINFTNNDFSVNSGINLLPDDSLYLNVVFNPSSIGTYADTMTISFGDTLGKICLSATGLGAPDWAMDTAMINATVNTCGDSITITRTLYNNGQGALTYEFGNQAELTLQDVLDTFSNSYNLVTNQLPSIYNFYDGILYYYISDGGGDMYDYGNYLSTNLSTGYINYSNDLVASSTILGNTGQYFTYKGTGIFLFAADLDGVNSFDITGGLGADGWGNMSADIITKTIAGRTFKGFLKRVYNAGDPSVNHLIIVEDQAGLGHTYSTNTNIDDHSVTGLNGSSRIYYLLFAGSSGYFYSNTIYQNVMDTFLEMIMGKSLPGYLNIQPEGGNVAAGDSTTISFTFSTEGLPNGTYTENLEVVTNQPSYPKFTIPYTFTVNGSPEFMLDNSCHQFDSTFVNGTDADSIMIYNPGCDSLVVTSYTSNSGYYDISPSSFVIPAFDSLKVEISFSPTAIGNYSDTLSLSSNYTGSDICVNGKGIGAPDIDVNTNQISVSINSCNDSVVYPLTIRNIGAGSLTYNFGAQGNDTLQILAITNGYGTPHYANATLAIQNYIGVPYKITPFSGYYASDLAPVLSGKDVIWIVPAALSQYTQFSNFSTTIQNFVSQGGGLVASGTGYYGNIYNIGIFTGTGNSYISSGYAVNVNPTYSNHPVVEGIPSTFYTSYKSYPPSLTNSIYRNLVTRSGYTYSIAAEMDYGNGRAIWESFDHNLTNTESDQILANALGSFYQKGLPFWLTASPDSGAVPAGDSVTVNLTFNSSQLTNGTYNDTVYVETNDPQNPMVKIPVQFIVNGPVEFETDYTCYNFDSTVVGLTAMDSIWVRNPGCDTLKVTGNSSSTGYYSASPTSYNVAPNDSVLVNIMFTPAAIGNFSDTITFAGNITDAKLCVDGKGLGAPVLTYSPSSFNITANLCTGIEVDTLTIQNTGQGLLNYDVYSSSFYTDSSTIPFTTTGATTVHTFNNLQGTADTLIVKVILNGDFDSYSEYASLSIDGSSQGQIVDNNIYGTNDTITYVFTGSNVTSWLADNSLSVSVINNYNVQAYSGAANHHIVVIEMRSGASWITIGNPSSGNVSVSGTQKIPITFDPSGLTTGQYTSTLVIENNDPLQPYITIPVTMNVVNKAKIGTNVNCLNFGFVPGGTSVSDSVLISNTGCNVLNISSVVFAHPDFSWTNTVSPIPVGGSAWLRVTYSPTAPGNINSSFVINNSDTAKTVCLTASSVMAPNADFDVTIVSACDGVVDFTDISSNNPNQWLYNFGDGTISNQQNTQHTYQKPGIYTVYLVSTNMAGSDTLTKQIDLTKVLYVDFGRPDSIFANTPAQFYDSSITATSWQWYFGDGSSSTLQNPSHTYTSPGTYFISFVATNPDCNKTINRQITVYSGIGIEEQLMNSIKVYPVPSSDKVSIDWSLNLDISLIEIYDVRGNRILSNKVDENSFDVDVSAWSQGAYFVKLTTSKGDVVSKQIIVER